MSLTGVLSVTATRGDLSAYCRNTPGTEEAFPFYVTPAELASLHAIDWDEEYATPGDTGGGAEGAPCDDRCNSGDWSESLGDTDSSDGWSVSDDVGLYYGEGYGGSSDMEDDVRLS
jgi:hypothetical protein